MPDTFVESPTALLDYKFDWANTRNGGESLDWLAAGETIVTATIAVDAGLTLDSYALTDSSSSVTVWLSNGVLNQNYEVACTITTSEGRIDTRTMKFEIRQR